MAVQRGRGLPTGSREHVSLKSLEGVREAVAARPSFGGSVFGGQLLSLLAVPLKPAPPGQPRQEGGDDLVPFRHLLAQKPDALFP